MGKINLDAIVVQTYVKDEKNDFESKCLEYEKLLINKKDSLKKMQQIEDYYNKKSDTNFSCMLQRYYQYKEAKPELVSEFLLSEPMLSEYLDEEDYQDILNSRIKHLCRDEVDLKLLKKGTECNHQFAIINDKFMCTKCSLNEDDLMLEFEEDLKFIIKVAKEQNMYIGRITEKDFPLLELLKLDYNDLSGNYGEGSLASIYRKYIKEARKLDAEKESKTLFDAEKSQELLSSIHKDIRNLYEEEITNYELHKLKLEEAYTAYVEILLLSGKSITTIYSMIPKENLEVLAKAIDHINNHKDLLTYFNNEEEEKKIGRIYTTIPEVNKKILSMRRR